MVVCNETYTSSTHKSKLLQDKLNHTKKTHYNIIMCFLLILKIYLYKSNKSASTLLYICTRSAFSSPDPDCGFVEEGVLFINVIMCVCVWRMGSWKRMTWYIIIATKPNSKSWGSISWSSYNICFIAKYHCLSVCLSFSLLLNLILFYAHTHTNHFSR